MNTLSSVGSSTISNRKIRVAVANNPSVKTTLNLEYSPSSQTTIANSGRGDYVSFCASGGIYSSSNYGSTFSFNSLNFVFTSIAMSSSGQYQVCVSSGLPSCVIYMSDTYGVSWVLRRNLGANANRFTEQAVISSTGQFIFVAGSGSQGLQSFYSNNFGSTFLDIGGAGGRFSCCISNDRALYVSAGDSNIYSVLVSATTPTEPLFRTGAFGSSTHRVFSNSTGSIIAVSHRTPTSFSISVDSGTTYSIISTPQFIQFHIISGIFFGCSSSQLFRSNNNGATWIVLYTLPAGKTIRSMSGNITFINMVYNSGEIVVFTLS